MKLCAYDKIMSPNIQFFDFHKSLSSSYTVVELSDGMQIKFIKLLTYQKKKIIKLLVCLLLVKQLATCFKYLKHDFEVFVKPKGLCLLTACNQGNAFHIAYWYKAFLFQSIKVLCEDL
jgi:hypothetical protein